jgi:hypothetical protein
VAATLHRDTGNLVHSTITTSVDVYNLWMTFFIGESETLSTQ